MAESSWKHAAEGKLQGFPPLKKTGSLAIKASDRDRRKSRVNQPYKQLKGSDITQGGMFFISMHK